MKSQKCHQNLVAHIRVIMNDVPVGTMLVITEISKPHGFERINTDGVISRRRWLKNRRIIMLTSKCSIFSFHVDVHFCSLIFPRIQ
jgi:hypothetical protein